MLSVNGEILMVNGADRGNGEMLSVNGATADGGNGEMLIVNGKMISVNGATANEIIAKIIEQLGITQSEMLLALVGEVKPSVCSGDYVLSLQGPEFVSENHRRLLQLLSAALGKNSPGKWAIIMTIYHLLYPASKKTPNAVRCMLRPAPAPKKPNRQEILEDNTHTSLQLPKTAKRQWTSCASCVRKRMTYGEGTKNPTCTHQPTV